MITEDFVSFETAKLLKEKGFYQDFYNSLIPVWHYNGNKKVLSFTEDDGYPSEIQEWYSAPTLQMAMKWLREVHHIPIEILWHYDSNSDVEEWYFVHHAELRILPNNISYFDTYEEACEAAIKYCLEKLI